MKIKVKREFRIQVGPAKVDVIAPGVYLVPGEMSLAVAEKVLRFGKAAVVPEKVAPENKVVQAPESKEKVAKKPVRRSRSRAKSKR